MATFSHLPTESTLRIFERCDDFLQATSLSSTSRSHRSIWEARSPGIIWHVGITAIVGFEDALMAARATVIVRDHFRREKLPPHPFPLHDIDGRVQKPSLEELNPVFNLERIVRRAEASIVISQEYIPEDESIWRSGSIALCTGSSSLAPLLPAHIMSQGRSPFEQPFGGTFTAQHHSYLLQFPIYNFESFERHDAAFGPLAEFLIAASRRRAHESPICDADLSTLLSTFTGSPALTSREAQELFAEITQLLAA
ncbi:hypothetical protein BJY00DRAFT_316873 [Aspergillus carlsbadensis]|nr:hypothetical protein BJY00DRAFT_316873 [Aspergillus carlsbadensis]